MLADVLVNAIAHTPSGGKIMIDAAKRRGVNRISITDTGEGMNQHELTRALEGIRMSSDGKGIERRHGLGIPLARQLIEAHGGTLDFQSRKNAGTTVTIILP